MAFEKNDKNINRKGRPHGPDKALERIVALLETMQFHPGKELVRMYRTANLDANTKARILFELLKYVEGKKADQKDPQPKEKPTSPEESRKNAEKQAELLKKLEADAQKKPE